MFCICRARYKLYQQWDRSVVVPHPYLVNPVAMKDNDHDWIPVMTLCLAWTSYIFFFTVYAPRRVYFFMLSQRHLKKSKILICSYSYVWSVKDSVHHNMCGVRESLGRVLVLYEFVLVSKSTGASLWNVLTIWCLWGWDAIRSFSMMYHLSLIHIWRCRRRG